MSLVLVTPPAQEPVSLADLKLHLRIDAGDTSNDSMLPGLITAARKSVERYCRTGLVTQTWRYYRDGWPGFDPVYAQRGYPFFYIPKPPFRSINTFQYVDVAGVTQTLAAPPDGYQLDPGSETLPARVMPPYAQPWPPIRRIPNNVIVEFVCGYGAVAVDASGNITSNPVPQDVQLALKMIAGHYYENREATAATGGQAIQEIPFGARTILDDYRCLLA